MINIDGRDFGDINKDIATGILSILDDYFDTKWLNGNKEHKFVKLCKRLDYYATVELLNFSYALKKLHDLNDSFIETWLHDKCKTIKGNDIYNSNADFFEVLLLGFLISDKYALLPTKRNNKGYDGVISFKDNVNINLSLKNYKYTKHKDLFNDKAKYIDRCIFNYFLNKIKLSYDINIFISEYPENFDNASKLIVDSIEKNIQNFINDGINDILIKIEGISCIIALKLSPTELLSNNISHKTHIFCKHHKNEQRNLLSKIQEGIDNLSKFSNSNDTTYNYLCIHINDVNQISKITQLMLKELNFRDVNSIILLQPLITRKIDSSEIHFNYFYNIINNPLLKIDTYHQINLDIFVGEPTMEDYKQILHFSDIDIDVSDSYVYTAGELFVCAKTNGISQTGYLNNEENGIFQSVVFTLNNQIGVISRKHKVNDDFEFL